MARNMGMGLIISVTEKDFMKENGKMAQKMDMGLSPLRMAQLKKVILAMENLSEAMNELNLI